MPLRRQRMRRTLTLIAGAALVLLALVLPATAAQAASTDRSTKPPVFTFTLITPNTATAPQAGPMASPGDWIAVTRHGTLSPTTGALHATGPFVHHNADGTVARRGTWTATALTGWPDLGPGRSGRPRRYPSLPPAAGRRRVVNIPAARSSPTGRARLPGHARGRDQWPRRPGRRSLTPPGYVTDAADRTRERRLP